MGFENRDWYREDAGPRWSLGALSPKWMLIAGTFLAFVAQQAVANAEGEGELFLENHFGLSLHGIRSGEVWQAATYALLHADPGHLFWNMVGLYVFAAVAEEHLSRSRVYLLYLAGAAGGAAGHLLWAMAGLASEAQVVVGASGAVTAILLFAALRAPRQPLLLFFVVPVPLALLAAVFVAVDLLQMARGEGRIAVQAHLGGAMAGALGWLAARRRGPASRPRSRAESLREPLPLEPREAAAGAVPPPAAGSGEEDARMDALLERIHAAGIASLTAEEREFLNRVARRYRGRK